MNMLYHQRCPVCCIVLVWADERIRFIRWTSPREVDDESMIAKHSPTGYSKCSFALSSHFLEQSALASLQQTLLPRLT